VTGIMSDVASELPGCSSKEERPAQQSNLQPHFEKPQQPQQNDGPLLPTPASTPGELSSEENRQTLWEASELAHPVYKKISAANGRINRMTRQELLNALSYLKLSTRGTKEVLKKRLKSYSKKQHLKENNVEASRKVGQVDYFIVIDFEATCESTNPPGYLHEIIEFPAVLVCAETHEVVSEFHAYCRPTNSPILTDFCKELTGITQLQVDSAAPFPTVLRRFDEWLKQMVPTGTFCIATDGPWDIDRFLKQQCRHLQLDIPHYFHRWVNIRKHFSNFYKISNANVELMLQHLGLEFQGRPHSGIDDSRNIARILMELRKDGADVCINESFR